MEPEREIESRAQADDRGKDRGADAWHESAHPDAHTDDGPDGVRDRRRDGPDADLAEAREDRPAAGQEADGRADREEGHEAQHE